VICHVGGVVAGGRVPAVIWGSNKFSLGSAGHGCRVRVRDGGWLAARGEGLVALLGGLAVFVAGLSGDLLPGGS